MKTILAIGKRFGGRTEWVVNWEAKEKAAEGTENLHRLQQQQHQPEHIAPKESTTWKNH